jgi:peptide/nickel transport system substrate-binding protein
MKKLSILLAIVIIISFVIAGCGGSTTTTTSAPPPAAPASAQPSAAAPPASQATQAPAAGQPQYGGTFIYSHSMGMTSVATPFDNNMQTRASRCALEPLLTSTSADEPRPFLADSWEEDPNGKFIILKLHKGIKFQDGTDFNAAAVKWNLEAFKAANIAGSAVLQKVSSFEIVDDYTLKLNLSAYDATILLSLAQGGIGLMPSPTALQKPATSENQAQVHVVGTGPFTFTSWSMDQWAKYKKWDGYWQKGKPYIDAVEIRNTTDITVAIMSFKAGEVHAVITLDPNDCVQLANEGFKVVKLPMFFVHNIVPDSANPQSPFKDKRVREALEYAINREAIAKSVGKGYFEPAYQMADKTDLWYQSGMIERKYDPAKAKQLLADAGYPNGFTTKLTTTPQIRKEQLIAVQTFLKDVGIVTNLDMADLPRFFESTQKGWDGLLLPGIPIGSTFTNLNGRFNSDYYSYPSALKPEGFKEKYATLLATVDYNSRMTQLKVLLKMLIDEAVFTPYIVDQDRMVTTDKVQDFQFNANHTMDYWNPSGVWLKK